MKTKILFWAVLVLLASQPMLAETASAQSNVVINASTPLNELSRLAQSGNAEAQLQLAVRYVKGLGVAKDLQQALVLFRKAAEQGNAEAQESLGVMYDTGQGITKDEKQAMYWYRKTLGAMYTAGLGVVQNFDQAVTWFRKAAAQGNAEAQSNLGMMYENGLGVERDYQQAAYWYHKAADQYSGVNGRKDSGNGK